ncbi:hypothetical protein Q0590_02720 [Rhodocytophaga aerolata]|uniref:Capsular biosynthesis protein n=1 Tax=Rhodocytophaga aerolata TaxID=455078 RepID=A0ABT8QZ79_9BACT|nr:hypothetical protein [Rhodocytophaga aerolata]MDO1445143.1 hypothetical protein [Rhodocytophaga aerolata]
MKPNVLFFARDYQSEFFPYLKSDNYHSILITLTLKEKRHIQKLGYEVHGCFEEVYDELSTDNIPPSYLQSSLCSDRYLRVLSLSNRIKILGKEIHFWAQILDKYRPNLIVNETIAIEISEVLYLEAEKRNIKYVSWMSFPIKNLFYWQTVPIHNSLSQEVFNTHPSRSSIEISRQHILNVKSGKGKPFYISSIKSRFYAKSLAKNLYWLAKTFLINLQYRDKTKNIAIFGENTGLYKSALLNVFNSLFRSYDKISDANGFEYIFYPLHYEPEAAISYMAEFYDNQTATIEYISKCLKLNQVLIIKEHPQQPGMLLSPRFQDLRKRLSNILYLPAEYPTHQLINNSKAVITLTSTAGFEGLIQGKPVVVLGQVFYDKYPYINKIESFDDLKKLIHTDNYIYPDDVAMETFLAQMIDYCYKGNPYPHSDLYSEANLHNIVSAIETELKKVLVAKEAV